MQIEAAMRYHLTPVRMVIIKKMIISVHKNVKKKNYMEAKQHVTQQYVTKEIKQGTKNYLQRNENKSMTIQNQWKEAKAIQRGKLQQYNLTSGNKYLKQSNLTPM